MCERCSCRDTPATASRAFRKSLKGLQKLDLLVVADPHPTTWASLAVEAGRKDDMYLLPACTQFEASGSRVASNRSLQWGEQIVKPIFESKNDLEIIYLVAKKLGFADKMFKNIKVENNLPLAEDILREMNRGSWSTGYCGQSPERLKLHMANQKDFDLVTMRAKDGPCKGDYYGLPWPCWGKPEVKHPGTPLLYNTNLAVMDGGGTLPRPLRRRSATASTCWPRAPIRPARRSRTAIRNSRWQC